VWNLADKVGLRVSQSALFFVVQVRGNIHHDRRLHQLMLKEEEKAWSASHPDLLPGLDGCMTSPSSPMSNQSTHRPFRQSSDISRASFGTSPTDSASSLHGIEETEHDDLRWVSKFCSIVDFHFLVLYMELWDAWPALCPGW
jgi:hypothetical protein